MKVSSKQQLTITLETQKEIDCMRYMAFCDVSPGENTLRQARLETLDLDGDEALDFIHELHKLLTEEVKKNEEY